MNQYRIKIVFFFCWVHFLSAEEVVTVSSILDLDKINGKQDPGQTLFINVETTIKRMESNILTLMRELDEIKAQMQELKNKTKKELADQQKIIDQQKQEISAFKIKTDNQVPASAQIDSSVTSSDEVLQKNDLPEKNAKQVSEDSDISITVTASN